MRRITRRRPIHGRGAWLAVLVLVAIGVTSCTTASPTSSDGWVEVGSVGTVEAQGVVYRSSERVYVVASDGGFIGLSDGAQHLDDERVLYCALWDGFIGPHGEGFDRLGRYLGGPASSDMDRVAVRVDSGIVMVNPAELTVTPDRSAGTPHSTSAEPACNGSESPPGFINTG